MVNIKEVSDYAAATNNISKAAAKSIVADAFAYIKAAVAEGIEVNIDKFGKFCNEHKEERTGRNPATNTPMVIPAKNVVKFKVAKDFKDMVAG